MSVWVVVKREDKGMIAGVFATLHLASEYIARHPYNGYIIEEQVVRIEVKDDE